MSIERTTSAPASHHPACFDEPLTAHPEPEDLACSEVRASARSGGVEVAIEAFLTATDQLGAALRMDARAGRQFAQAARQTVAHLMADVERGKRTLGEATRELHLLSEGLREQHGAATSDLRKAFSTLGGGAAAESFAEAQARVAAELFGKGARELTEAEARAVQLRLTVELTEASAAGKGLSRVGLGFLGISMAFSAYNVASAEDKGRALAREGAVILGGKAGALLGGAAAGALCGPGAPACVPAGAFLGDLLGSLGAGALFDLVEPERVGGFKTRRN